jgi:hypothetical protein
MTAVRIALTVAERPSWVVSRRHRLGSAVKPQVRFGRYGPLARLDSAADMPAYLKDMHLLVQRQLAHDWKEQSGHCARNVTDPDCS